MLALCFENLEKHCYDNKTHRKLISHPDRSQISQPSMDYWIQEQIVQITRRNFTEVNAFLRKWKVFLQSIQNPVLRNVIVIIARLIIEKPIYITEFHFSLHFRTYVWFRTHHIGWRANAVERNYGFDDLNDYLKIYISS